MQMMIVIIWRNEDITNISHLDIFVNLFRGVVQGDGLEEKGSVAHS